MTTCPTLRTERLVLRPFTDDDLPAYTAVLQTPEVRASLHLPDDVGEDDAWAQMALFLGQWELRGTGQWAIEVLASGRFVGRAGLHRPQRQGWPGTEVGWTLHPEVWGSGYATEAGAAAVAYGFDTLGLDELVSNILHENTRSQAVARRLGFTPAEERVLPHFPSLPHVIWRLRRSDWTA